MICIWQTNTSRDHSVSADSVTVSLVITTMNTPRITSMARTSPTRWTTSRTGSCRTTAVGARGTTPTTAGCSSSTRPGMAATATFANVNMDLASKTPRWSLWYMSHLESKSDGTDGEMAGENVWQVNLFLTFDITVYGGETKVFEVFLFEEVGGSIFCLGFGKNLLEVGAQTFSNKHWISCRVIRRRFDSRDNLKVSQLWLEQLDTATALVRQCTVSPKQQQLDDVSPKQRKSWKCVRCKSVARCWCILILPNIGIAKSCWLLNIVIGVDNQILVMVLFVNYQYW